MDAIDFSDRKPRNLVACEDNLIAVPAIMLRDLGGSYSLPDTATKRFHTLGAKTELFALRLDVTALVSVGPGVTAGGTAVAVLGPGNYTIRCTPGSKVLIHRFTGTGASDHAHIAELI
jgi:hypothetical protein